MNPKVNETTTAADEIARREYAIARDAANTARLRAEAILYTRPRRGKGYEDRVAAVMAEYGRLRGVADRLEEEARKKLTTWTQLTVRT